MDKKLPTCTYQLFYVIFRIALSRQNASHYPPASEASREVANLNERKHLHTPVYVSRKGSNFELR